MIKGISPILGILKLDMKYLFERVKEDRIIFYAGYLSYVTLLSLVTLLALVFSAFSNSIPGCPKGYSRSDILAKIPIAHAKQTVGFEDASDGTYKKREYFGPQNIEKLEIKILDDYERVVNINNMNYSLTLEFDCLYDI